MDEAIERSLRYLEANLKADITPADLAEVAGYSLWHFGRVFSRETGQSVAQHMLRRRLERALEEIASGRRAADVAPEYGFETYSGFYRAFVKLYGCSPKRYLRIYGGFTAMKTEVTMKHYTMRELRRALAHWGMEKAEIGEVPVMYDGRPDDSAWRIGGAYRLRVGERVRLLRDLRITGALAACGFMADAPVRTMDGHEFIGGEEIFTLSRVIPGNPLNIAACYGDGGLARACGEGIARLHGALRSVAADVPHDSGDMLNEVLGWVLPAVRLQDEQWSMGLGATFFEGWRKRFSNLYPRLPRQLIHHNLCPSYVQVREGVVTGFTQFDMIGEEARLFDLCYAATGILSETAEEAAYPRWLNLLEEMLHGYNSASPLTAEEKLAAFDMLCGIQMICVACFDGREPYRELARRNRAMLTFIAAHRAEIDHITRAL